MSEKKLFRVSVEFDFYAWAEDHYEACNLARDAADDLIIQDQAHAIEVEEGTTYIMDGWSRGSLVYHNGSGDIELGECLDGTVEEGDDE